MAENDLACLLVFERLIGTVLLFNEQEQSGEKMDIENCLLLCIHFVVFEFYIFSITIVLNAYH